MEKTVQLSLTLEQLQTVHRLVSNKIDFYRDVLSRCKNENRKKFYLEILSECVHIRENIVESLKGGEADEK